MTPLLVALISFTSAVIVAVVTHVLSKRRKSRDELSEMRLKAYVDFINSTSRIMANRRLGKKQDAIDDLTALNDAKVRMCLCAPPEVVEKLTEFWDQGATLEQEGEVLAFTRLCLTIRESLGNQPMSGGRVEISNTFFRLQPSSFSFKADTRPISFEQLQAEAERLTTAA